MAHRDLLCIHNIHTVDLPQTVVRNFRGFWNLHPKTFKSMVFWGTRCPIDFFMTILSIIYTSLSTFVYIYTASPTGTHEDFQYQENVCQSTGVVCFEQIK